MSPEATFSQILVTAIASSLADEIVRRRRKRLEQEAKKPPFKPRRHYASGLSGCVRQMVYAHVAWEQKEPFSPDGVAAMQDGIAEERLMTQELLADGFEIVEQQVQIDDDRYWVTGKIDGKLCWQGRKVPFEMKRLKPFVFAKIDTAQDFKDDPFLAKYLKQLTLYLYLHSEDVGLFILSNGLGDRKVIVVPLDYELAESILKSLDAATAALKQMANGEGGFVVDESKLPPRIPYHSKICGYCPFKLTCLPDMNFGEGAALGAAELTEAVARLQEIKSSAAEAEKLKKEIKKSVEDKPLVICGEYLVTGAWKTRTVPAAEARTDRYWQWEVESKAQSSYGHA